MRNVFLLTIGMFALGFDAYVMAGLLPNIGAAFKVNDSQIGLAVSTFTLCYALAAPVFATLLAGKPIRRILITALVIFSVSNGASAMAPSFPLLLIARSVAGVGAGLYSPLAFAAAANLVSKEKQGRALGMILGGMSIGTVIGVPLGLVIAEHLGWQGTFWLITALGIISGIGIAIWFPNFPASAPPSLGQRITILTSGRVSATVGITFVASIASLGLYTYIAPVLQYSEGIHIITPYLWVWGFGGLIGSLSIGILIDRTGRPDLLMVGILSILTFAIFCIPLIIKIPIISFLPFIFWGAMGWASVAPQQHILLHLQPKHGGAALALNSSANYLGGAVGSALGGIVLLAGLEPSKLPFAASFLMLVALMGQFVVVFRFRSK